jgi:hypothetical protein
MDGVENYLRCDVISEPMKWANRNRHLGDAPPESNIYSRNLFVFRTCHNECN